MLNLNNLQGFKTNCNNLNYAYVIYIKLYNQKSFLKMFQVLLIIFEIFITLNEVGNLKINFYKDKYLLLLRMQY